ncbi:MAG: lysylphosphatidylglycerol synthase domain-containing protein [Gemmatimonadaceae bacterium]
MTASSNAPSEPSHNSSSRKKTWWRILQVVFLVAALAYTAQQVAANWTTVKTSAANMHPSWPLLLGASAIVMLTYAALIQSWRVLIAGEGSSLRFVAAARIWFIANLGRYIPGKVWSIAALNVMAAREGVPGTAAAGAAVLGTLINIGAGFGVISLSGSRLMAGLDPVFRWASVICSVIFVMGVIALPWILPPTAAWAARRFGKTVPPVRLPAQNLLASVTINVLSWFCYGWAFMVFSHAVMPGVTGTLAQFTGVWTASYTLGYLAFFAPGGIGVREITMGAAMVGLGMASASDAALIAGTSRLWLSLVEVLPGLIALLLSPASRRLRSAGR